MRPGVAAASLLLAAAALASCGESTVDRKDLEAKIAEFVQRQTGTDITVHCPDSVKADRGSVATCTTELSGAPADIKIVFTQKGKFQIAETRLKNP